VLRLVAFDMDGTLVDTSSSWAAVHAHFGAGNSDGLRRFLANEIDDEEFIQSDIAIWKRHAPDLTLAEIRAILDRVPLMPGAGPLLHGLHRLGIRTAIVSGGIDLLAHRIAEELDIEIALANGFEVGPDGRLTGDGIVRVPIHGKEQVLASLQAQLGIEPSETASVGNSEIDLGLFRRSRVGVAFLPEDEAIRAGATHVVTEHDLARVLPLLEAFPAD
jgi:phosphoserine phosphatase